jgi:hypothetical protein
VSPRQWALPVVVARIALVHFAQLLWQCACQPQVVHDQHGQLWQLREAREVPLQLVGVQIGGAQVRPGRCACTAAAGRRWPCEVDAGLHSRAAWGLLLPRRLVRRFNRVELKPSHKARDLALQQHRKCSNVLAEDDWLTRADWLKGHSHWLTVFQCNILGARRDGATRYGLHVVVATSTEGAHG